MTITTDTTLLHDPRRQAALLYWQGFYRSGKKPACCRASQLPDLRQT